MTNTVRVQIQQIHRAINDGAELARSADIPGREKLNVARLFLAIECEAKAYNLVRNEIAERLNLAELEKEQREYARTRKPGDAAAEETLRQLTTKLETARKEFERELKSVLETEIEISVPHMISEEVFETVKVSPACIMALDPFTKRLAS